MSVPMSRPATRRPWAVRATAALAGLACLGCQPTNLTGGEVTSTPVATPIVVANTPTGTPVASATKPVELDERETRVRELVERARKAYPGRSGVVFVDLASGFRVEFEPTARFESASLAKLVILAELYRQFEVGDRKADEKLTLLESQKRGGSGSLKNAKEGTQYTLEELAKAMITESDNTATQMLTDLLGRKPVEEGAKAMGLSGTTFQRDIFDFEAIDAGRDNYMTAKDAANFLQQLARLELPGAEPMAEILEQQKRNDMIGHGYPPDVRVAHKTGELDGILNDAGIVYAPRGGFILAVLSDGIQDKEAAKKVWAGLSLELLELYSEPTAAGTSTPPSATEIQSP